MHGPDYIEVNRKSHELAYQYGRYAHRYAAKLAAQALAENQIEEYEFWKAVEAALRPRGMIGEVQKFANCIAR